MASKYTYEDFQRAAQSAGLLDSFSEADLRLATQNPDAGMSILNYKLDYGRASTPEARALANAGAERIRSEYGGYTAGANGSGYYLEPVSPASFRRAETPTYDDGGMRTQYLDALDALKSYAPFSYDAESDPSWQSYRKQYTREGQRAAADVLGQHAAMTGGMPSTAAVTASQQAGDYYAAQMADKLPELYQAAYQRYLAEYERQRDRAAMLGEAEERNYARYLDALAQHNAEQSFGYGQLADEISFQQQRRSEARSAEQTALENRLALAQLGGSYGDYTGLGELGITPNTDNLLALALANNARTAPIGSGRRTTSGDDGDDGDGGEKYGGLLSEGRLKLYQQTAKQLYDQYGSDYLADWLERIQKEGHLNQTDALAIGSYVIGGK